MADSKLTPIKHDLAPSLDPILVFLCRPRRRRRDLRVLQVHEERHEGRLRCKSSCRPLRRPRSLREPSLRPRALELTLFPRLASTQPFPTILATDATKAWEACVDSCRDKDGGDFVEAAWIR